jgi:hypothetical protein
MDKSQFWLNLVVNEIVDLMENVFARREKFSIETKKNNKPLFEDQNMLYDLVVVLFVIDYYNQPLIVINLLEYYSIISK